MRYSEEYLNDKKTTKSVLVEIILNLQTELDTLSQGEKAWTRSEIITAQVEIKKKVEDTKVQLAKIKEEGEAARQAVELEYSNKAAAAMGTIISDFQAVEAALANSEDLFKTSIEVKEAETKEIIADLDKQVTEKTAQAEVAIEEVKAKALIAIEGANEEVEKASYKAGEKIAEIKKKNERELSDLAYENKTAIERENAEAALSICEKAGLVPVKEDEYKQLSADLEAAKAGNEEAIKKAVSSAVSSEIAKATNAAKEAKFQSDLEINSLKTKNAHNLELISDLKSRIAAQDEQLKQVPEQIQSVVSAVDTNLTVNNDLKK